ncbi:PTH2-domain-containing protein, partial [Auriscalpium vulgare]
AAAVASASLGFWLGSHSARRTPTSQPSAESDISPAANASPETDDEGSDSDAENDGDLANVKPGLLEECKLVLVVRTDLRMTTGKVAAQHATLACYKTLQKTNPALLRHWERTGQTKIALKCDSEDELLLLQATAQSLNICARSIQDAGRTQIAAGSRTVLGIGPAPTRLVNQVTKKLRLL